MHSRLTRSKLLGVFERAAAKLWQDESVYHLVRYSGLQSNPVSGSSAWRPERPPQAEGLPHGDSVAHAPGRAPQSVFGPRYGAIAMVGALLGNTNWPFGRTIRTPSGRAAPGAVPWGTSKATS